MNGTRNWLMMLGWPFACEIMPGANPQNAPPTIAAARLPTRWRDSTWYQAYAVPARPTVVITRKEIHGPNSNVTGTSGIVHPRADVFAIKLRPKGALSCSAKNGLSPCVKMRAACSNIHWKKIGSSRFSWSTPSPRHRPQVT
jgi:hypothetical protein